MIDILVYTLLVRVAHSVILLLPAMDPLWVDKYRPKSLDRLNFHPQISQTLHQLAETNDFPHMIMHGPEGSGKKTRVYAFLAKLFGDHVFKIREEERTVKPEGSTVTVEFSLFVSNYHIEITPADNDHHDRHIVQHVVKEIAVNSTLESKGGKGFKVLVINEADKLTKEAQGALRRTMQKYMGNCRMILVCTHAHRLIQPIRSRCINVRVPAPTQEEIKEVLAEVAKREESAHIPMQLVGEIAANSDRNLRTALVQLQISKYAKNSESQIAPYKKEVRDILNMAWKEQTPSQLKVLRERFYGLLVNCVEGRVVIKEMIDQVIGRRELPEQCTMELVHQAAEHEKTLLTGNKAILHLESFGAHLMEQVMASKQQRMRAE